MLGEGRRLVNPPNDGILGGAMTSRKDLNQTRRAYYACLETRGYTLAK